jgi:hypothetical protein
MTRSWSTVTPHNPCPICGKPDWCSRSADDWIACRRVNAGHGIHRLDKAGVDYWLYPPKNATQADRPAVELPLHLVPQRATADTLHQVYHALLTLLTLSLRHRQNLRQRGLSDGEVARRQYRTLSTRGRAELAGVLVDRFGPEVCARVPGLYLKTEGGRRWWTLAGIPGLLIPVLDVQRRIVALVIRSDDPEAGPRYSSLSSKNHGGPGSGAHVHIPLSDALATTTVRVTEGPLKADVVTVLSGMLTVGLPGASMWRQGIPVIASLQAQRVVLAFDADARRKWSVARALQGAAGALQAAGFAVLFEVWPEQHGKGIDDLLAAGHRPEVVEGRALQQAVQAVVCAAHLARPHHEVPTRGRREAIRDWQVKLALARQREAEEIARGLLGRR